MWARRNNRKLNKFIQILIFKEVFAAVAVIAVLTTPLLCQYFGAFLACRIVCFLSLSGIATNKRQRSFAVNDCIYEDNSWVSWPNAEFTLFCFHSTSSEITNVSRVYGLSTFKVNSVSLLQRVVNLPPLLPSLRDHLLFCWSSVEGFAV